MTQEGLESGEGKSLSDPLTLAVPACPPVSVEDNQVSTGKTESKKIMESKAPSSNECCLPTLGILIKDKQRRNVLL